MFWLWATDPQGLSEEDEDGTAHVLDPDDSEGVHKVEHVSRRFLRIFLSRERAATNQRSRVCPFCLYCEVSGVSALNLPVTCHRPQIGKKSDKELFSYLKNP